MVNSHFSMRWLPYQSLHPCLNLCIVVTVLCLWCFLHQFLQQNCLSYSPVIVHTTHCRNHLSCRIHGSIVNVVYTYTKMDECNNCLKKFQSHSTKITCCICSKGYHMKCITLCPDYTQKLTEEMNIGIVLHVSCLFPYNLISDENDFIIHSRYFLCITNVVLLAIR